MIKVVDGVLIIKLEKGESQNTILPTLVSRLEHLAVENNQLKKKIDDINNHHRLITILS
jgi:hypothetical protein